MDAFHEFLLYSLWRAHFTARRGKRLTNDEHSFEVNEFENMSRLVRKIENRSYKPSRGIAFIVKDPKYREVVAAPYVDRIIHHFIFNITNVWIDRHLINDSYSCRVGKGTLYGQQRLRTHMNQVRYQTGEEAFVGKFDLRRYFVSINRKKLLERALWALDMQFHHCSRRDAENGIFCDPKDRERLYDILKFLWCQIILDDPMKGIRYRGKRSDWALLDHGKSLVEQSPGIGIVIGNLTSQELSNVFLDALDRFIIFDLGYKHYGRYVDDFFIVVPASERKKLISDVDKIEEFLRDELGLELHQKKRLYKFAREGVPFTGGVVYPDHISLTLRERRRAYESAELVATGRKPVGNFIAQMGTTAHFNQRQFYHKLYDNYGWDYDWK